MDWLRRLTVVAVLLVLAAPMVQAEETATVILLGPAGSVRVGDEVPVEVRLSSGGFAINAAELTVRYPSQALEVVRVAREQSVFSLWPEPPRWDTTTGTISLVGGKPGGTIVVKAAVVTIYFKVLAAGTSTVQLSEPSTAYVHDGQPSSLRLTGSPLSLITSDQLLEPFQLSDATVPTPGTWSAERAIVVRWTPQAETQYSWQFSPDIRTVADDAPEAVTGEAQYEQLADGIYYFTLRYKVGSGVWSPPFQWRFMLDATPPEPFTLSVVKPNQTDPIQLLAWNADDRTSGVAQSVLTVNGAVVGSVTSPQTINPSWLGRPVTVTVTDQAGNARAASLALPGRAAGGRGGTWPMVGLVSLGLIGLVAVAIAVRARART